VLCIGKVEWQEPLSYSVLNISGLNCSAALQPVKVAV